MCFSKSEGKLPEINDDLEIEVKIEPLRVFGQESNQTFFTPKKSEEEFEKINHQKRMNKEKRMTGLKPRNIFASVNQSEEQKREEFNIKMREAR